MTRNGMTARYGPFAQLLHWGMFVLIVAQWIDGKVMDDLPKQGTLRDFAFDSHETLGVALLLLIFLRIWWRMAHPVPMLDGATWQRHAARLAHVLLYGLLIALPVSGYLTFSAQGHPTSFFGWEIPAALAKDRATARTLKGIHELLGDALVVVVALHAAAALWHHWIVRDDTLRRMLPRRRSADPAP